MGTNKLHLTPHQRDILSRMKSGETFYRDTFLWRVLAGEKFPESRGLALGGLVQRGFVESAYRDNALYYNITRRGLEILEKKP